jgi:hypothetical protein
VKRTPRVLIIHEGRVVEGIVANAPVECIVMDGNTEEDEGKMAPEVCRSEVDERLVEEAFTLAKEGKAVEAAPLPGRLSGGLLGNHGLVPGEGEPLGLEGWKERRDEGNDSGRICQRQGLLPQIAGSGQG